MPQKIYIRLASHRVNTSVAVNQRHPKIFTPGEVITSHNEFMRLVNNLYHKQSLKITLLEDMVHMKKMVS